MMSRLFLQVVSLSLSASIVTALVLLLRALLKKAPRAISCALWVLVGLRLILPSLPESRVSVIPEELSGGAAVNELQRQVVEETVTIREDVDPALYRQITVQYKELPVYRDEGHNYVVVSAAPAHTPPKTFGESVVPVLTVIWIAGAGLMLLYMAGSYLTIRRRLRTAVRMEAGVWESDEVTSPFILGFVRPRIYLPTSLSKEEAAFVLAHERTHIRRGDQIWKPLGFVLLAVYWFNPLFWLAYYLLCRDIEAACDEKVIREQDPAYRKAYSETLLALNIRERTVSACPLAFAENGVKERIKNILSYRKPAFWLIVTALVVSIVAAGCALTDPSKKSTEIETEENPEETQETVKGGLGIYAAEKIEASFSFDANGRSVYPDDYAGWYPDGKDMVLCLKDPTEESINRYLEIAVFKDSVHVKKVSRSYNELEQMLSETAGELQAEKIQIIYYCVDVENNGLRFCVTKDFVETVRALLQDKYPGVPSTVEGAEPFNYPEWTKEGSSEIPGTEGSSAETPEVRIPLSGKYHLTGRQYTERGALTFDLERMEFFFPISEPFSSRPAYAGGLLIEDGILYAVDYGMLEMDEFTATHAETVNKMRRNGWAFPFRIVDEKTLEYIGDSYALEVAKRYVKNGDLLVWKDPLPEKTEPSDADPAETGPGEISPDGDQGGTSLINPASVLGTYTFSEGEIRDYIGEWGGERYFVLQIVKPGHPDMDGMYRYAVGHARKDAEDGSIQILADLDCDYYHNVSKLIDGTIYVATDKGIYSVTTDGNVKTFIGGKEQFATYPSAGNMFLYRYGVRNEKGMTFCLEAYYFWPGVTIRYLTLENAYGKESNYENNRHIVTASALQDGFCYVLAHANRNEVWYQPCAAQDIAEGVSQEPVLLEKNQMVLPQYVAGNEQFYVLVYGAGEPTIHLVFRDEPATSKEVKTGAWGYTPLQATSSRTGNWRFTCGSMWFDIDAETRTCSVYKMALADAMTGWNLFGRTEYSQEIIMLSSDCHSMLLAQDETDSVDYAAKPLTDFRLACGTSESKDKAEEKGLNAEVKAAGGLPVFRLDSEEDLLLFSKIFDEPAPNYGKIGLNKALQTYDSAFFREKVLFAVYGSFGPSSLHEEYFRVGSLLRNNVLHLRLGVVVPIGTGVTADVAYSWILIPMERSAVRDVIAYDATWTVQALPPDWTEGVNPDWRKQ